MGARVVGGGIVVFLDTVAKKRFDERQNELKLINRGLGAKLL